MDREAAIREIQEKFQVEGRTLNELQRRHWAAMEATKLGRGGITIVGKALQMSPNTIKRGIQEIAAGDMDSHALARVRRSGGGRKSKRDST